MGRRKRSWSALLPEVLALISEKTATPGDFARFRAVCRDWRSAAVLATPRHLRLPFQLPALAFPFPDLTDSDAATAPYRFYSLADQSIHELDLSAARGCVCCGYSHGWLAFIDTHFRMFLLDPLTGATAPLPPLQFPGLMEFRRPESGDGRFVQLIRGDDFKFDICKFAETVASRVVLSSSTLSAAGCMALFFCDNLENAAFCRPGKDDSWTMSSGFGGGYEDCLCYNGQLYASCFPFLMRSASDAGDAGSFTRVPVYRPRSANTGRFGVRGDTWEACYLLESGGDLLMVVRSFDRYDGSDRPLLEITFQVHRLHESRERRRWVEVRDLGCHALFLGLNRSVSLSARDFPGIRRNCIYFSDYHPDRGADLCEGVPDFGIYHLEDGSVERFPCTEESDPEKEWRPSTWITPTV